MWLGKRARLLGFRRAVHAMDMGRAYMVGGAGTSSGTLLLSSRHGLTPRELSEEPRTLFV